MAKQLPALSDHLREFIEKQRLFFVFFVGTAAQEGRVNISLKGMDSWGPTAWPGST